MKKIRVIIFSTNRYLRDFFMLEAQNFGFDIACFTKLEKTHNDISDYDIAIIDIDTVKHRPLNTAKRQISVSRTSSEADVFYPLSIKELRDIYIRAMGVDIDDNNNGDDEPLKIVFYENDKNLISLNNKKYILSDAEYGLLKLLCDNTGEVVLREEINKLFCADDGNIAEVYICKLRKKLEESLGKRLIYTVRSTGSKIIIDSEWR